MTRERQAEVAVIGGGIIGCAIAYYVSKSGMDCMLIEKHDVASGTSSHCDGNVTIVDKDPGFDSQMSLVSQNLMVDLAKELDMPFEYRALGSILVCENDAEMEAAEEWVDIQKKAGLKFNLLDRSDIRQESPYFADDIPGGLECETDSLINPYLFCYALIDKATQYGLKVHTFAEVTSISKKEDFWIETTKGYFYGKEGRQRGRGLGSVHRQNARCGDSHRAAEGTHHGRCETKAGHDAKRDGIWLLDE